MNNLLMGLLLMLTLYSVSVAEENYMIIHKKSIQQIITVSEVDSITFNSMNDTLMMLFQARSYIRLYRAAQQANLAEVDQYFLSLDALEASQPDMKRRREADTLFSYAILGNVSLEATLKVPYRGFSAGTVIGIITTAHPETIDYYVKGTSDNDLIAWYIDWYNIYEY